MIFNGIIFWFTSIVLQIFEDGINEPRSDDQLVSLRAQNRNYLVSPINGVLKYHRLGNQERNDPEIPFEKASLVLADVSLTITEVLNLLFFQLSGFLFIVLIYWVGEARVERNNL